VVLLNDQFFAAREFAKTDGYRMDNFDGGLYGALGVASAVVGCAVVEEAGEEAFVAYQVGA
jgi:hypothetical protein